MARGTFIYREYHFQCVYCGRSTVGNVPIRKFSGIFDPGTYDDEGFGFGNGWDSGREARRAYTLHKRVCSERKKAGKE